MNNMMKSLLYELENSIDNGCGPFLAAICKDDTIIAKARNSVIKDNLSTCHAEINCINLAQKKLKTYNLSPHNLSIYVTAEPCSMCLGAIMWAGIKNIYYSVSSDKVEAITGFYEGYKPDWISAYQKMGFNIYPNIESDLGIKILKKYVQNGGIIYKPN